MLDLVGGDGLEEEAGVELAPGEREPNVVHRADTRLPAHRPNTYLPTVLAKLKSSQKISLSFFVCPSLTKPQ